MGNYIRVNLIGKVTTQEGDNKYYIALRYVGALGIKLEEIKDANLREILAAKSRSKRVSQSQGQAQEEEEKESICQLSIEDIKVRLESTKKLSLNDQAAEAFKIRKDILLNIEKLLENKILFDREIIELMQYSSVEFGNLDYNLSHMIFRVLSYYKHSDNLAYAFLEQLGQFREELNLFYLKDKIDEFLYKEDPESDIKIGTKEYFLMTFHLRHDAFEFNLKATPFIATIERAFDFFNYLGYTIAYSHGQHLDVGRMFLAITEKFGAKPTIDFLMRNFSRLLWKD